MHLRYILLRLAWNPIGIQFSFFAKSFGGEVVYLPSPSYSVPVVNNCVELILVPQSYATFSPPEQSLAFFYQSQQQIYGAQNVFEQDYSSPKSNKSDENSKILRYRSSKVSKTIASSFQSSRPAVINNEEEYDMSHVAKGDRLNRASSSSNPISSRSISCVFSV